MDPNQRPNYWTIRPSKWNCSLFSAILLLSLLFILLYLIDIFSCLRMLSKAILLIWILSITFQVEWRQSLLKYVMTEWQLLDNQSEEQVIVLGPVFLVCLKISLDCPQQKETTQLWVFSQLTISRSFINNKRKVPSLMDYSNISMMLAKLVKLSVNSRLLNNLLMFSTWLRYLSGCHYMSTRLQWRSWTQAQPLKRRRLIIYSHLTCLRCQVPTLSISSFQWQHQRLINSNVKSCVDTSMDCLALQHFLTLKISDKLDMRVATSKMEH